MTSEELEKLMADFEASKGPVETIPVDFTRERISLSERQRLSYENMESDRVRTEERKEKQKADKLLMKELRKPKPPMISQKQQRIIEASQALGLEWRKLCTVMESHGLSIQFKRGSAPPKV